MKRYRLYAHIFILRTLYSFLQHYNNQSKQEQVTPTCNLKNKIKIKCQNTTCTDSQANIIVTEESLIPEVVQLVLSHI